MTTETVISNGEMFTTETVTSEKVFELLYSGKL